MPTVPPPTEGPTATTAPKLKVGEVTDLGGVNDKSFNALAWKGVQDAMAQLGVDGKFLQSTQQSDYAKNIQQLLDEKEDLIVTVGFLLGVDTATAAKANPNQKFAIVDYTYPDCYPGAVEGKDCGSATDLTNVRGLAFQTDQAAFLAGYLAAGMTKTGNVGTFGGISNPDRDHLHEGFRGRRQVLQHRSTPPPSRYWAGTLLRRRALSSTTSLPPMMARIPPPPWSRKAPTSSCRSPAALASARLLTARPAPKCLIIGVDADWFVSAPEYNDVELSSVQKKIDVAVFKTIQDVVDGKFTGGTVTYTLADGGVDLAPFHNFDSQVPANPEG